MKAGARRAGSPPPRRRRWPPALRRAVRWAAPAAFATLVLAALPLSRSPAGQALLADLAGQALSASAALGLVVTNIEVEGRETTDTATIMRALAARRGTPILAIDPDRAKQQLETLPWVRSATIERRLPGSLYVRLVERHPLAVWQHGGKHELIDRDGAVIAVKDLSRFARLPTVVGDDAASNAAALIDMLGSEPELAARVTAAVRVDGRRWNLRIDNATDVLLPEDGPAAAWRRLASLERERALLQREVQTVDLRLPDRLVLRVKAAPAGATAPARKAARAGGKST
jgi:cell division protein FtsQ